jgi:hypothetical protein
VTRVVGLSGYARSGKDTAAQVLLAAGWERRSFADRLREFLLALDPIVFEDEEGIGWRMSDVVGHLGWEDAKDQSEEVRRLLQRCGTEAGRKVLGEDVWVNATLGDIGTVMYGLRGAPPVVITDVRFPNEARAVQDLGGMVIRVNRPGIGPKTAPDGTVHSSETALDDWPFDAVIENDGTLEELEHLVALTVGLIPA